MTILGMRYYNLTPLSVLNQDKVSLSPLLTMKCSPIPIITTSKKFQEGIFLIDPNQLLKCKKFHQFQIKKKKAAKKRVMSI